MEHVYALGVSIIEFLQDWFEDYEEYFDTINNISNPHHLLETLFPLMSIVDSVFAAQLVLCMAFGGWLNAVMKWCYRHPLCRGCMEAEETAAHVLLECREVASYRAPGSIPEVLIKINGLKKFHEEIGWLLEDRPFWWVHETDFYDGTDRPIVRQTSQTCETGPGCPSGHSEMSAMLLMLTICWIEHVMTDWKLSVGPWWRYIWYPLCGASLGSVMLARLVVGAHFPHQVFFGALLGGFLAPFLCIYVTDPFIWQYSPYDRISVRYTVFWHTVSAVCTILISVITYFATTMCGFDPMWTVKLAFRWCEQPEQIRVTTTPMYSLAHCTGHLMGWALCVTPTIAKYRNYTKSRSLVVAAISTGCIVYALRILQKLIPTKNPFVFYMLLFIVCAIKVPLLLRAMPALAMWPYSQTAGPGVARQITPKKSKLKISGKAKTTKKLKIQ